MSLAVGQTESKEEIGGQLSTEVTLSGKLSSLVGLSYVRLIYINRIVQSYQIDIPYAYTGFKLLCSV